MTNFLSDFNSKKTFLSDFMFHRKTHKSKAAASCQVFGEGSGLGSKGVSVYQRNSSRSPYHQEHLLYLEKSLMGQLQ